MFDFDATKLMIVGVLALIVLGPNELPRVMRQIGQMLGKMRRMAGDFQGQFMDAMREAELEDIRKEVTKLGDQAKAATSIDAGSLDPVAELRSAAEGSPARPAPADDPALDIPEPEPFKPVTSEDLAAAFADQSPAAAGPAAVEPPPPAPTPAATGGKAADAFYLRPGATKTQSAGVELAPDEEITFRKAPAAPAAGNDSAGVPDAPRRRSARPTGA